MIGISEGDDRRRGRRGAWIALGVAIAVLLLVGWGAYRLFARDPWQPIVNHFRAHSVAYGRVAGSLIDAGHAGARRLPKSDAWASADGSVDVERTDDGGWMVTLPQELGLLGFETDLIYSSGTPSLDGKDLDTLYSGGWEVVAPHWYVAGGD